MRDALVNGLAAAMWMPHRLRRWILRSYGIVCAGVSIAPGCFFGGKVRFGPGTIVNYGCFFNASAPITIGREVGLGMQTMIVTATHDSAGGVTNIHVTTPKPVTIGDGCWIGARVLILPGVTIGEHCVIAAGSVVTRDCRPFGLYAGVPATRKKDLRT